MPERGQRDGTGNRPDGDEYDGEDILESLPGIIAVATLGFAGLAAVTGSGDLAPVIAVVGWFLLTPLSAILADTKQVQEFVYGKTGGWNRSARDDTVGDDEAALEALKQRYARGEIDEAEFERRTAMLLENETVDDVADRVERTPDVNSDHRTIPRDEPGDTDDVQEERAEREYET
jgi:uncharacterized membrane protein